MALVLPLTDRPASTNTAWLPVVEFAANKIKPADVLAVVVTLVGGAPEKPLVPE